MSALRRCGFKPSMASQSADTWSSSVCRNLAESQPHPMSDDDADHLTRIKLQTRASMVKHPMGTRYGRNPSLLDNFTIIC